MAPLPDNDKAPDKHDKNKQEKLKDKSKGSQKDETVSNLNDRELKALLDEAITYKNPKDREGKSDLFKDLLLEAEETERIARAASAGGSELVRHCNPAARRQRHNGGSRVRRYGAPVISGLIGRSVSERGTHGGSLDNLGKEELYESGCRRLKGERKSSTSSSGASSSCLHNQVSSRQREGGSLPCNVNAGDSTRDFFDDTKRHKDIKDRDIAGFDAETDYLLENDHLQRSYEERLVQINSSDSSSLGDSSALSSLGGPKYTTSPVSALLNVEDSKLSEWENGSERNKDPLTKMKVDENGNALNQAKEKKKKKYINRNENIIISDSIVGHQSAIINNVEKLLHFIEGTTENPLKPRSKQFHKHHNSGDGSAKMTKKRHTKACNKENGSTSRHELKKSNSLGEISEMKLGRDFGGNNDEDGDKVVLRTNKSVGDRTRERRSWGTVEPPAFQTFYNASSLENLETAADNWVVTRPKKKTKKRRNSVSSASAARQTSSTSGMLSSISNEERRSRRAPSPDLSVVIVGSNVKTTRSMPHSEKSNDSSSDVDSVHSLPMDGPISYADIAKNSEKKKLSPEKQDRPLIAMKEKSPQNIEIKHIFNSNSSSCEKTPIFTNSSNVNNPSLNKNVVPDVHNIKSFPTITGTVCKTSTAVISTTVSHHSGTITMTSDKAVQSTFLFEESFVNEKSPVNCPKNNSVDVTLQTASLETMSVSDVVFTIPTMTTSDTVATAPINSTSGPNPPISSKKQALSTVNVVKTKGHKDNGKTNVPNRDSSGTQQNQTLGKQIEIQNSSLFFSQLMRDPAQYATQKMPPDIVDVSTLEKIHFMNCSPPQIVSSQTGIQNDSQVSYMQLSNNIAQRDNINGNGQNKSKRKRGGTGARGNCIKDETGLSSVCDINLGERDVSSILNGVSDDMYSSPEPSNQSNSPPPVIILSGHHKDIPSGLVFGFDINEQLLLEDTGGGGDFNNICNTQNNSENNTESTLEGLHCRSEEWAKMFKPPNNDKNLPKHNHDKIISFISNAWDNIVSQNIQYYSDEL